MGDRSFEYRKRPEFKRITFSKSKYGRSNGKSHNVRNLKLCALNGTLRRLNEAVKKPIFLFLERREKKKCIMKRKRINFLVEFKMSLCQVIPLCDEFRMGLGFGGERERRTERMKANKKILSHRKMLKCSFQP